jgi:hypothetical protein
LGAKPLPSCAAWKQTKLNALDDILNGGTEGKGHMAGFAQINSTRNFLVPTGCLPSRLPAAAQVRAYLMRLLFAGWELRLPCQAAAAALE